MEDVMDLKNDNKKITFNRDILSSTHINFLFDAGVNGNLFPQLNKFKRTEAVIKELGGNTEFGIESGIDDIDGESNRCKIKSVFIAEFKEFYKEASSKFENLSNLSLKNLMFLLKETYRLVHEAQNRNSSMKQINIYTLNYDDIVEQVLDRLGYFYNSISASNTTTKAALMNVIGYDYNMKKYIPSFMVNKLHGDIGKPIIPGREKYREMLNEEYFEIAFHMKEQLCRQNSILIVIGYSGNDKHINKILQDCLNTGLTMYWYKYSEDENLPSNLKNFNLEEQIIVVEQDDYNHPQDSTKVCYKDMMAAWEKKLDK